MIWRVQLLGRMALSRGSQVITRFESSRVAALLARLALFSKRPASREELIELLWPDEEPETGRQRLRQALYSLRRQLEPPGIPSNTVLSADRIAVSLNPQTFTCDAVEFEMLVGDNRYREACDLYAGELLPGFYDDWILEERYRLQELFEELPEDAAPAEPAEKMRSRPPPFVSLPAYLTQYFGREEERRKLLAQLSLNRLITITGLGGIGKTRIAIEVARAAAVNYERTAFVPLEECASPDRILEHVPPALQLPPSQAPPMDQMLHALAGCKVLLVLDNFEQLAGPDGAALVVDMLTRFPEMSCLVTSRRLLGVPGESEVPLSPLPSVPDDKSLEETAVNPGVALFLSRAQSARPGFQITDSNRSDLSALCNSLDGLPLALEIAASRIRAFTPTEMLRQLEDRFRLLARPAHGTQKDQRHRSILATLEWSWQLLTPVQQRFLSKLSVFRGGWTAELAAEVCNDPDAGERLEALVMDSLVVSEETRTQTTRFRLLDMVRTFARDRLDKRERDNLIVRHQTAFLGLAQRFKGGDQSTLLTEGENLKAALESAIADSDAGAAFALCVAVDQSWLPLVGPDRALELLQSALSLQGGPPELRVETLALASHLALLTQNRALALSLSSEALKTAGDDPSMRSLALVASGRSQMAQTREATILVRSLLEEALPLAESVGADRTLGSAFRLLGVIATRLGDYPLANRHLQESLKRFDLAGDLQGAIYSWDNLAGIAVEQGDLDKALQLYGESRRRAEEINDVVYSAKVLQNLATIVARQQKWEEALDIGQECVRRNQALGNAFILAFALWNITEPLAHLRRYDEAAKLMGFIERFWVEQYDPLNEIETGYCAMIRTHVAAALGDSQTSGHWRAGARMTLNEAVGLALKPVPG